MSSKEEHATMLSAEHARAAKQGYVIKGPKTDTFSARMPAYTYTSLCPDPALREPPKRRKEAEHEAEISLCDV
ncbi:hypothetical protein [Lacrimispora sp.]|uniref:hypothetical protein n=1 Tax=Lacrimispora sp. TaxID=2719234 RepID=UPI0028640805|nr:hypothetical protein [Lacrimispora sp.]MDR7813367.1 hypothetical protein [Lacrimispora sp.]